MPVTSRVCFVKFQEPESVGVSQHLTNTVFVDRALIVVPFAEGLSCHSSRAPLEWMSLFVKSNNVTKLKGSHFLSSTYRVLFIYNFKEDWLKQKLQVFLVSKMACKADFTYFLKSREVTPQCNCSCFLWIISLAYLFFFLVCLVLTGAACTKKNDLMLQNLLYTQEHPPAAGCADSSEFWNKVAKKHIAICTFPPYWTIRC